MDEATGVEEGKGREHPVRSQPQGNAGIRGEGNKGGRHSSLRPRPLGARAICLSGRGRWPESYCHRRLELLDDGKRKGDTGET